MALHLKIQLLQLTTLTERKIICLIKFNPYDFKSFLPNRQAKIRYQVLNSQKSPVLLREGIGITLLKNWLALSVAFEDMHTHHLAVLLLGVYSTEVCS